MQGRLYARARRLIKKVRQREKDALEAQRELAGSTSLDADEEISVLSKSHVTAEQGAEADGTYGCAPGVVVGENLLI